MTILEFERRKRGLSQADLAQKILYDRSMVSRLENKSLNVDKVHPRLKYLLEEFFGQSIETLLGPVPDIIQSQGLGEREKS